ASRLALFEKILQLIEEPRPPEWVVADIHRAREPAVHDRYPRLSTERFQQPRDTRRRLGRISAPIGPVCDKPLVRYEVENAGRAAVDFAAAMRILPTVCIA